MAKIDVRREKLTIRLYTAAIALTVVAILMALIIGSSEMLLYFAGGFGILFILFLIIGIYAARKRRITHVYSTTGGYLGTNTARTFGIIAGVVLLLPLIAVTAMYGEGISLSDVVPGIVLLIGGIIALIGGLAYKVEH